MAVEVIARVERDMTDDVRQRSGDARTSLPSSFLDEMAKGGWLEVEREMHEALPGFQPARSTAEYGVHRYGFDVVIFVYSMKFTQQALPAKLDTPS